MPLNGDKVTALRGRFARLHENGMFLMPNAWDVGSALVLQSLGFKSVATTSSGFAASLGRHDQNVALAELAVHVADLCSRLDIPLSIDAEAGYSRDTDGLSKTVSQLAATGASGISIEDYIPGRGLVPIDEATERVARFCSTAHEEGLVVTARAENHLYGADDLNDTIARLSAYEEAGADVVYAPGLKRREDIGRVVREVGAPINVLLLPGGPSVTELAEIGVRRISTGGALAFTAYGALAGAARQLRDQGTFTFTDPALSREERNAAFGDG